MASQTNPARGREITKGTIAVWEHEYKLIHYLDVNKSLLFNLKEDPEELNNLIEIEKEKKEHLFGLLRENIKKANERIRNQPEL